MIPLTIGIDISQIKKKFPYNYARIKIDIILCLWKNIDIANCYHAH